MALITTRFDATGRGLADCDEAPTVADGATLQVRAGVPEWAPGEGNARRLWEVSEEHLARHRRISRCASAARGARGSGRPTTARRRGPRG
jgi:hypothetical protein